MDKNNLTVDGMVKQVFEKLNAYGRMEAYTPVDLKRVTDVSELMDMLKVETKEGQLTDSIFNYLYSYNANEGDFYRNIEGKVLPEVTLNPHNKPDPYEAYFTKTDTSGNTLTHIQKLFELLEEDKETGNIQLLTRKEILHIGEKGSGKTQSQNYWLYHVNDALEKKDIVWVRLDASKLLEIWKNGSACIDNDNKFLITPETYILGQLVYVFCKHFQKEFIDIYSDLFGRIVDNLEKSPENNIEINTEITTADAKLLSIDTVALSQYAKKYNKGLKTVIDFLKHFEYIIAVGEKTFGDKGKTRRNRKGRKDATYSFLIDKVLLDSQKKREETVLFKAWMAIARVLQDFIVNNYKILYIIDGLDNINFFSEERKKYLDKLSRLLYQFPLPIGHDNELLLISLRDTTLNLLEKTGQEIAHRDRLQYRNLDLFYRIDQQTKNVLKSILDKKINNKNMLLNKHTSKEYSETFCYMVKVLKKIKEELYPNDFIPEEEMWNFNIRCFLYNHITLAKYITFKYYSAGKPNDFNIKKQINTYKDINLLLNGHLCVCEWKNLPITNVGTKYFNLFGYPIKTSDYVRTNDESHYFTYTYILLLLRKSQAIVSRKICEILMVLNEISELDCENCIDKLVSSGMIKQKFSGNDMRYIITAKGEGALQKFYNDIHFLYYASLDTKVPKKLLENFKIAPNNFKTSNNSELGNDRNYPPYCVITGINFLRYLKYQNNKILECSGLKERLENYGIDISTFELPIEENKLSESVRVMAEKIYRKESYKQIFANWLSEQL
jgi:hypothetical protein